MTAKRTRILVVLAIIAATGVLYLTTIRPGHRWGGDFSLYISHAKNIAEGRPYADTGFIYNPYYPHLSPDSYPPVYPLLLAPVYKAFGLNLTAMKVQNVLLFLACLAVLYLFFRRKLPFHYTAVLVGIIAFNPWFWDFKDEILSDISFLLFTYLALLYIQKSYDSYEAGQPRIRNAVMTGVLVCLSYGARSLGLMLVPSVILHDLIRYRKPTRFSSIVTAIFVAFVGLQTIFLRSDASYLASIVYSPESIIYKLFLDTRPVSDLWANGYLPAVKMLLFAVLTLLAFVGYIIRLRTKISYLEIFPVLYMIPIVIAPAVYGTRYLIPVIPLYVYYALAALNEWPVLQRKKLAGGVFWVLTAIIAVSYAAKYTSVDYGPLEQGIAQPDSVELFDFIKTRTEPDDVIIFRKPRVMALMTGRPSSVYHLTKNPGQLWEYFGEIDARYVVVGRPFREDMGFLVQFLQRYAKNLEQVFANRDFKVYRISAGG